MPVTAPPLDARPADLFPAILERPDDDAPRLVYADWLDERAGPGDADYAAFIRCQIELARLPACDSDPPCKLLNEGIPEEAQGWCLNCCHHGKRRDELLARERELWGSYPDSTMREVIRRECPPLESWNVLPGTWCQPGHYTGTPLAIVRRGFVDEIRCTAAAFVGGPCGRCEGEGGRMDYDVSEEAPTFCIPCDGTGRTPGLAAALAGRQPIVSVVLTDKRPDCNNDPSPRWAWFNGMRWGGDDDPANLPYELFHPLGGDVGDGLDGMREYESEADALAALSAACVALLTARTSPAGGPANPSGSCRTAGRPGPGR